MASISKTAPDFILASGSPRRKQLTEALGWRPHVITSGIVEERAGDETPLGYTERLAREKAMDVVERHAQDDSLPEWVLAADTIVVQGTLVLEKPRDRDDAIHMLANLSGSLHEVITSFCWVSRHSRVEHVESVVTRVHFRLLEPQAIERYVDGGEPMDKAGAYGIQGLGKAFVERIEGSYSGVMGLPVAATVRALEELGGLDGFPFI